MKEGASARLQELAPGKRGLSTAFPFTTNESYPTTSHGSSPAQRIYRNESLRSSHWRAIPASGRELTLGVVRPGYSAIEPVLPPRSLGDRYHVADILDRDILCGVFPQNSKHIVMEIVGNV